MTEAEILEKVRALVRETMRNDISVDMASDFRRDLRLDSLKLLELVVAIENHFEISLAPGDEAGLNTVGDVVRFLSERVPK